MTIFRIIKVKNMKGDTLSKIFDHFNDWDEVRSLIKKKTEEKLIENLVPRIDSVNVENWTFNIGTSKNIEFKTLIQIPGAEETIWVNSNNSKVFYPYSDTIILQQPSNVFERLFRLALTHTVLNKLTSPFKNASIIQVIANLKKEFEKEDCEVVINRIILHNTVFHTEKYQELNIKKKKINLNLIQQLSNNSERWHAFTCRITQFIENSEDKYSVRIDQYGNVLLYGKHFDDRAEFVATILGKTTRL